jgi:hypothetical protein
VARRRRLDLGIGIGLGIVLGIGVIVVFVFVGSEGTIDAPRISGVDTGKPGTGHPHPVPLVLVRGGAPPASGPARLQAAHGQQVRFRLDTDIPIVIGVPGLGVSRSLDSGSSIVSFKATRPGQFPVIITSSHIGIATLRVSANS